MRLLLIFGAFLGVSLSACQNKDYTQLSNGKCYKIIKGSFTYFKAADMCQQQNGQLATLHKSADSDAIAQYLSSGLWEEAWIGLQCTAQSDCFWDDGTKFDYSNFNNNPDFSNGKNCVMLKAGLTAIPRLRDVYNGWTPKSCYSATDNALCEETPKGLPGCGDYSEFEGNCYKFQPSAPSWLAAETICAQQGGHLENMFIFNLLKADGVSVAAWIGLYNTVNQYYWADSSIVDYYNFAGPTFNLDPICYALSTTNLVTPQKWVPESCDNDLPFLCQRATGSPSPVPPFVPPTTTSTTTTTTTTMTTVTTTTKATTTTPTPQWTTSPTLPVITTSLPTAPTVPQVNMTVPPTSNTTASPTFLPRGRNVLPL